MKQVVKTVLGIVAFVGLVSLGFHFGALWGILAIIVCYAVNRYFDWRTYERILHVERKGGLM
jgi:hypothetical protein